jgi:hypothetical protein
MMRRYSFFLLLILFLSVGISAPAGRAATANALVPTGSTEIPFSFGPGTWEQWSGGALVVVEYRFSGAPGFRVYDRDGNLTSRFTFTIPDAGLINIYSFSHGWDGALAMEGSAYTNDSRAAAFFAWVSPDGHQQTVVRTDPFIPRAVTIAADGTIWVAGDQRREPGTAADRNQYLIRRYDKTGKLLGSFIPWSSLTSGTDRMPPSNDSVLVSSKDRVGWYSWGAGTYIEFALDGTVISRLKIPDHLQDEITHVALCDDGSVFVGSSINENPTRKQKASWRIFALDRNRGEWRLIPRDESWGSLYGCDGTRLATTTNFRTISWLEPSSK